MNSIVLRAPRGAHEYPPCIWMQAGVVRKKRCRRNYECMTCRFDRSMTRTADEQKKLKAVGGISSRKRARIISWKEKLRELAPAKRPCLHHMKGRIDFRACNNEYRCGRCEFDQYFQDQYRVHAVMKATETPTVKGFKVPHGYYFHRGHTWVKIEEGSTVRVGMDDFALRLLGPMDRIESPLLGKEVHQGREDISVYRGIHSAKVLSPVSGVVTSMNPLLRKEGGAAMEDPFSAGWIMRVHATRLRQDLRALMIEVESREFLEREVVRLYRVIEEAGGPLATDGGHLADDIYGRLPQLNWRKLVKLFLGT